ncbi:MAG: sigma-70 family RNA polymerase sigma factor [Phycisphaerales bacterium]|nr:MAG: sigma-70 family RNA polymerase sigma factor [Phycisphaerales bacterium]
MEHFLEQRSDTDLVRATRQGDRSAYAQLIRRHYQAVFLVCLGVLGNVHDAEDMAQETVITGFEKIRQLREPGQFRGWMIRIARNSSINLVRRKTTAEKALDRKADTPMRHSDAGPDLQQAVAQLPWDLRLPLVMYYFDGRSVKSVAQALEISTSGVYLKLRTALKELHELLTAPGETP